MSSIANLYELWMNRRLKIKQKTFNESTYLTPN